MANGRVCEIVERMRRRTKEISALSNGQGRQVCVEVQTYQEPTEPARSVLLSCRIPMSADHGRKACRQQLKRMLAGCSR